MKIDGTVKTLLLLILLCLGVIAFRPMVNPLPVQAQSSGSRFYVEPGATTLRKPDGTAQMYGKVFIDMETGDVWGFPTGGNIPYPTDPTQSAPIKSHPMYLGKFVLSDAVRK